VSEVVANFRRVSDGERRFNISREIMTTAILLKVILEVSHREGAMSLHVGERATHSTNKWLGMREYY
jgi:hypothetical protein